MARYCISYMPDGSGRADDEVEADTFADVADPLTDAALWIDFVRYVDDGHADLLAQRVCRVRADCVARIVLIDA